MVLTYFPVIMALLVSMVAATALSMASMRLVFALAEMTTPYNGRNASSGVPAGSATSADGTV